MKLSDRIQLLQAAGRLMDPQASDWKVVIQQAYRQNPWFTPENCQASLEAIRSHYLDAEALERWVSSYPDLSVNKNSPVVGLVMAGNIPMVGFHDWLCCFVSGCRAQVKLSDKDRILLPHFWSILKELEPATAEMTQVVDRLHGFQGIIATGSDNTSRYFDAYFGGYPHIIRRNRHAVGVLTGRESVDALDGLVRDTLQYFGLGCRNVSKLFVPKDYDLEPLAERFGKWSHLLQHHKYKNNYDYYQTALILNKESYRQAGPVLLVESKLLSSPLSQLYFEEYAEQEELIKRLQDVEDQIQVLSTEAPLGWKKQVLPGEAQQPALDDYADQIDTLAFLTRLKLDSE